MTDDIFVPALVKTEQNVYMYVSKIENDAIMPTRNHAEDAGLDFYALHYRIILPINYCLVPTGIRVLIPPYTFGLLKPKGKSKWLVGAGVIDEGYTGEIMFKLFNPTGDVMEIHAGDPIGQLIILPLYRPDIKEISEEEFNKFKTERGSSGGIHAK